jgi:hypothetical protein
LKAVNNIKLKIILILAISFVSVLIISYLLLLFSFPHIVIGAFDFCLILIAAYAIQKINTKSDV